MRIFGILLAVAFVSYFTPIEGHNQQKQKKEKKIYVAADNLYFGNEGILWRTSKNNWIPIKGVKCDSKGIYLAGSRVTSWSYYVCSSCGWHYDHHPSQCENPECSGTDFYQTYEDIYDRG